MLLLLATAFAGDPCPIPVLFAQHTPAWRDRNADLAALKHQRQMFGVSYRGKTEVKVQHTVPQTRAAELLRKGDVIRSIQGQPITSSALVGDLLGAATGPVTLEIERAGKPLSLELPPSPVDPLILGLSDRLGADTCRERGYVDVSPEQDRAIQGAVFDANRGFRCADAHRNLGDGFQPGTVVVVRGGNRVLLSMPGWATTCVGVDESDGADAAFLDGLLDTLTKGYVKDRHDNP